jgi:hypothetical protein
MADWTTIASLATAAGTMVLAVATFASVKSANNAARTAERAIELRLRPLLVQSRETDPPEPMMWYDRHWATVLGGHAIVEHEGENIYLAMSVRNVGSGIAVILGWSIEPGFRRGDRAPTPIDAFRHQGRDLYIPPGDSSFWQSALRGSDDHDFGAIASTVAERSEISIELLYSDHEGGQRVVSRFLLSAPGGDSDEWVCSVNHHWNVDRDDPRQE